MATIPASRVKLKFAQGDCDRCALYAVNAATAGDLVDVAGVFSAIKIVTCTNVTSQGATTATWTGTIINVPAGYSSDSFWMVVWGDAGDVVING
jgi:hypothetical protein